MKKLIVILLLLGGCYEDKPTADKSNQQQTYDFQYQIILDDNKQVQMNIDYFVPYTQEKINRVIITPWESEIFKVNNDKFMAQLILINHEINWKGNVNYLLNEEIYIKNQIDQTIFNLFMALIDLNHDETGTIIIK